MQRGIHKVCRGGGGVNCKDNNIWPRSQGLAPSTGPADEPPGSPHLCLLIPSHRALHALWVATSTPIAGGVEGADRVSVTRSLDKSHPGLVGFHIINQRVWGSLLVAESVGARLSLT